MTKARNKIILKNQLKLKIIKENIKNITKEYNSTKIAN